MKISGENVTTVPQHLNQPTINFIQFSFPPYKRFLFSLLGSVLRTVIFWGRSTKHINTNMYRVALCSHRMHWIKVNFSFSSFWMGKRGKCGSYNFTSCSSRLTNCRDFLCIGICTQIVAEIIATNKSVQPTFILFFLYSYHKTGPRQSDRYFCVSVLQIKE